MKYFLSLLVCYLGIGFYTYGQTQPKPSFSRVMVANTIKLDTILKPDTTIIPHYIPEKVYTRVEKPLFVYPQQPVNSPYKFATQKVTQKKSSLQIPTDLAPASKTQAVDTTTFRLPFADK